MRLLIATIAVVVTCAPLPSTIATNPFSSQKLAFSNRKSIAPPPSHLLEIRGGASKNSRKKKNRTASLSSLNNNASSKKKRAKTATGTTKVGKETDQNSKLDDTLQKYNAILPLTRIYISCVAIVTLLGAILGEENSHAVLALDPIRLLYGGEIWRLFTAASFLGPPSIGLLMSGYYLFEYGSNLERVYGTAQHFVFLVLQIGLLAGVSMLFGQPFFGPSIITAMLHVMSRAMPRQQVKWLIFNVPYWALPYGLMIADVLQAGPGAGVPHVMGIMTGHFYYYHKFIWPKMGGEDWLVAPDFLVRRLDPSSVDADAGRKKMESVLKKRKKGKGRKISG